MLQPKRYKYLQNPQEVAKEIEAMMKRRTIPIFVYYLILTLILLILSTSIVLSAQGSSSEGRDHSINSLVLF